MGRRGWMLLLGCWLSAAGGARALEPREVFLLVNKNVPDSRAVADHYCARRGVPRENQIVLDLPTGDDISRADYLAKMVTPVRAALRDKRDRAKVLLTVYGVPLRVGPATPTPAEQAALEKLKSELTEAQQRAKDAADAVRLAEAEIKEHADSPLARVLPEKRAALDAAHRKVSELAERQLQLSQGESQASVDSELMLLWWDDYPLSRWVVNPLYFRAPRQMYPGRPPLVMTCRLDGPTPAIAKRLVDDALTAEKTGLKGKAYVDARGIKYDRAADPGGTALTGYDESFRETGYLLAEAHLDVTLDDKEPVFPPGACPGCALYCGWYALTNYVPCCNFVPGAVAWHLASFEAVSLHNPGKQWCGNLLRDGAAVTLGPVAEPYTIGFPKPAEFFGFLATGEYPLVECYAKSTLLTSWMMTLVGDPLYNPYAKIPLLKLSQVKASPRGSHVFPGE